MASPTCTAYLLTSSNHQRGSLEPSRAIRAATSRDSRAILPLGGGLGAEILFFGEPGA